VKSKLYGPEQEKIGFRHVYSPHIGQKSLWEKAVIGIYTRKMYSPMMLRNRIFGKTNDLPYAYPKLHI
jgi:threonyl-tRNA synthetase